MDGGVAPPPSTTMDAGGGTVPIPKPPKKPPVTPGTDAGQDAGAAGNTLLHMVSVPPNYTLAGEILTYFPKPSQSGTVTMQLVNPPSGMVVLDDQVKWTPDESQGGDHDVDLEATVEAAKVAQKFKVHVGLAQKMAEEDLSTTQMGQVVVNAPLSPIAGAGITVPAGALDQQTTVTISQLDTPPEFLNAQGALKAVKFGPSGLSFLKPATVALPYDKAHVANPNKLGAFVYDETRARWVSVPVISVDLDNALLMAKASHFSIYAASASNVDTTLTLERMSAASTCLNEVVGRMQITSAWSAVDANSINTRTPAIDALIAGGASSVQALLSAASFSGTLRAVSVLDLYSGQDPDRVLLGERVLVASLYAPGDGTAVVTHADALGNVIGSKSYADITTGAADIAARLAGAAAQARFGVHGDTQLALAGRVHLLYASTDTSQEPLSVDDLGASLVDIAAPDPVDPSVADDGADVDCDRLLGGYDPTDDSQKPTLATNPDDVATALVGQSVRLQASVLNAGGATPTFSFTNGDPTATLTSVGDGVVDFSASAEGRYSVQLDVTVGSTSLSHKFAIDVSAPPQVNTAPSCKPTASSAYVNLGDPVSLSAVVHDAESLDSTLTVQWGLVDRSGSTPTLVPSSSISASDAVGAFAPALTGDFEIGCVASDGLLNSEIGSTWVSVLAANANIPPEDLLLTPMSKTIVLGNGLALHASATDRNGDALTFTWSGSTDLGTPTHGTDTSDIVFTPTQTGSFDLTVSVTDGQSAPLTATATIGVVSAPLSTTDADGDGFPPPLDCDDGNRAVNPDAAEICGNTVDENCDGVVATNDCDGDGYSVQQGDCDDADPFRHPNAPEACDGVDNDCNGHVDDGFGVGQTCTVGVGACQTSGVNGCSPDGSFAVCLAVPGVPQLEICDQIDNDCNGQVDENGVCNAQCSGGRTYDPQRQACVCSAGLVWTGQQCAAMCGSGQTAVWSSQTCRAALPGDTCATAIDLGTGGTDSGTLAGRGEDLLGCWSSTTSLRVYKFTVQGPGDVISSVTGNVVASVFQNTCGGQPIAQCQPAGTLQQQKMPPGTYYVALGGEGSFSVELAEPTGATGCTLADGDGDGVTLCKGDCDDTDGSVYPGASESCNGKDDDCNGQIDDLQGSCSTGLPGVCAQGALACTQGSPACTAVYQPNDFVEVCGDGLDNNCDGTVDEPACTGAMPGELCSAPLSGGYGGVFSGTFANLEPPSALCGSPSDGHEVIQVTIPTNGIDLGAFASPNVHVNVWQGSCGSQALMMCAQNNLKLSPPPGTYLLELVGQGSYSVTVGMRDAQSGACLTPDADQDGVTVCNGDCNDLDPSIHPGAAEVCNGKDDDCDNVVDDLQTPCSTGLPGACGQGQLACASGGGTQCNAVVSGGQSVEYCGDGIDNNCNGQTDEQGCTQVALGEICTLPIDVGNGGTFSGDLTNATDDVQGTCSGPSSTPDHVYTLTVPNGVSYKANLAAQGQVMVSVLAGGCGPGFVTQNCFDASKLGGPSGPASGFYLQFDPGTYYFVVEGTGAYSFSIALSNPTSGSCLTPDGDGDGYAPCYGDCNDADPSVHPGATEVCNGKDDDCNGMVDDVQGSCNTGLPGICQAGAASCGLGGTQLCQTLVQPGSHVEYCGDGLDNDCNGMVDEPTCTQLPPGETCANPVSVGQGGTFSGDLTAATDDVASNCGAPPGGHDRVYHVTLTQPSSLYFSLSGANVLGELLGNCSDPASLHTCFGGGSKGPGAYTSQWLNPGDYAIVVDGSGPYVLGLGISDSAGMCQTGDADSDGYTLCNGDCNDQNPAVHVGATEICDGLDNDCNGSIDDPQQTCSTGLPGACANGSAACVSGALQCTPLVQPNAQPEYCGDNFDNDCDNLVDEAGCTQVAQGELCTLPFDLGVGGTFNGDLTNATDDVSFTCDGALAHPDQVYRLHVPSNVMYHARFQLAGVALGSLYMNGCGAGGTLQSCFGSKLDGSAGGPAMGAPEFSFAPGDYSLVVEGNGPYTLSAGIRVEGSMQCLTPDGDGDGYNLCDGDCDDQNPARHPGVAEVCDGVDNDCNGMVDDITGTCNTGLPGACAIGNAGCQAGVASCQLKVAPGQLPEYCGDGVDNDCNGQTDETGCVTVSPGEVCFLPIDIGTGGHFSGDMSMHTRDVIGAGCWGSEPDMVYSLTVPQGQQWHVDLTVTGAGLAPLGGDCSNLTTNGCFGPTMPPPPPPDGGTYDGGTDGGTMDGGTMDGGTGGGTDAGTMDGGTYDGGAATGSTSSTNVALDFAPGTHLLLVQGSGPYSLDFFIRDVLSGNCITPDGDGDGFNACQGDCNDHDPSVHPGATESCDGVDNDCNGVVDDIHGACVTGLQGACAQGSLACSGGSPQCVPAISPVQEVCSDGIDNNCDGQTDEGACTTRESCANAEDVGKGGTFYGNLDAATADVQTMCGPYSPSDPDHVYMINLPPNAIGIATASGLVSVTVYQGMCGGPGGMCQGSVTNFGYGAGGTYYIVVKGQGPYAISIASNSNTAQTQMGCSVGDLDGDGQNICMGDCNEGAANVHGGAVEACDGIDNDCNGQIDDLRGICTTGLPGVCNQGTSMCSGGSAVCQPNFVPNQLPEYCADNLDNNCDGLVDETGCLQLPPGDICSLAIDMGQGGTFSGDLSAGYHSDLLTGCGQGPDVVYHLSVPNDGHHQASVRASGNVYLTVQQGGCGGPSGMCMIGGSQTVIGPQGGDFYFVIQANGAYTVSAAIRDTMSGTCSVGDADSDSFTLCDNDCDDSNSAVHPGAVELCDNIDNNCNGTIDDISGTCATGLPGECSVGVPSCAYPNPQPVCNSILQPGSKPDYCGDGKDENCDGAVDEPTCTSVPQGDVCDLAIDIGQGGTIFGNATGMNDDGIVNCGANPGPDVVYSFTVPPGTNYDATFFYTQVDALMWSGGCDLKQPYGCSMNGQHNMLMPGTYFLAVKAYAPSYRFSVGLRDMSNPTMNCLTPDGDGDGVTLCQNDCDDTDGTIHPGAPEICGDGKDNDCNGTIDDGCP